MDLEDRLKQLQLLLSHALSAADSAKIRYLALAADLGSTPAALARAKVIWQQFEAQKAAVIAQMVALEELELDVSPEFEDSPPARSVSGLTWRTHLRSKAERVMPASSMEGPWHATQNWWVPT